MSPTSSFLMRSLLVLCQSLYWVMTSNLPHLVLCKTGIFANITNLEFLDEKSAGPLPVFVLGDELQSSPLLHWVEIFCLSSCGPQPNQPSPVRDRPGGTLKYHILTKAGPLLSLHLDYRLPDESKTGRQRGDHLVAIRKNVATINSLCLLACHQAQVLSSRLKQGIHTSHGPDV